MFNGFELGGTRGQNTGGRRAHLGPAHRTRPRAGGPAEPRRTAGRAHARPRPADRRGRRAVRLRPGRVPAVLVLQAEARHEGPGAARLHRRHHRPGRHPGRPGVEGLPGPVRVRRGERPGTLLRPPATLLRAGRAGVADPVRDAAVAPPAARQPEPVEAGLRPRPPGLRCPARLRLPLHERLLGPRPPGLRGHELAVVRGCVLFQTRADRRGPGVAVRVRRGELGPPADRPHPGILFARVRQSALLLVQAPRTAPGRVPGQEVRVPAAAPAVRRRPGQSAPDRGGRGP